MVRHYIIRHYIMRTIKWCTMIPLNGAPLNAALSAMMYDIQSRSPRRAWLFSPTSGRVAAGSSAARLHGVLRLARRADLAARAFACSFLFLSVDEIGDPKRFRDP